VRETVPAVADQVEALVQAVLRSGEPITGVEVNGQRADGTNAEHSWLTNWYPLTAADGTIVGVSVVAEDVTSRKRAEAELAASERALRESEARFRELADNVSQMVWTADPTGRRTWYNRRWLDYTGATLDEMLGWGWQKFHHPDHLERVLPRFRQSFDSGTPWEDTFPLRGRDGEYRWFLTRALPIRDENGEIVRWFGTNTDVTEQIEAENALRELNTGLEQRVEAETRERLRVWNVSQDLLLVANGDGTYLRVNPAWTAALGWPEADLVGKSAEWLAHPDDRERTRTEFGRVVAGQRMPGFVNRLRHQDGLYRWLSWKASLDDGRIYAVARDITDLRQAETALNEARNELARVTRQTTLAAMTASIAHEINQPLAAIATHANAATRWLVRVQPDIDEARAALRHIGDDARRASEVVAGIRAMFRNDRQERQRVSVNALVQEILGLVRSDLESRGIAAESELPDGLPDVMAERVQLQQVILNLVMNAAEAMSAVTDRKRSLLVQSRAEPEDVLITVADSGTGIDPKDAERIFEAFYSTKPQGMGMGLSICRSIVEAHGGRLWAEAGVPHGSVFHVQLPIGGTSHA
jgi:PAS domain S-box-containing protein